MRVREPVARVAARPLASAARIAAWVRCGYPGEAGRRGHNTLIALCGRTDRVEAGPDR